MESTHCSTPPPRQSPSWALPHAPNPTALPNPPVQVAQPTCPNENPIPSHLHQAKGLVEQLEQAVCRLDEGPTLPPPTGAWQPELATQFLQHTRSQEHPSPPTTASQRRAAAFRQRMSQLQQTLPHPQAHTAPQGDIQSLDEAGGSAWKALLIRLMERYIQRLRHADAFRFITNHHRQHVALLHRQYQQKILLNQQANQNTQAFESFLQDTTSLAIHCTAPQQAHSEPTQPQARHTSQPVPPPQPVEEAIEPLNQTPPMPHAPTTTSQQDDVPPRPPLQPTQVAEPISPPTTQPAQIAEPVSTPQPHGEASAPWVPTPQATEATTVTLEANTTITSGELPPASNPAATHAQQQQQSTRQIPIRPEQKARIMQAIQRLGHTTAQQLLTLQEQQSQQQLQQSVAHSKQAMTIYMGVIQQTMPMIQRIQAALTPNVL